jgi:hypothetical protein
VPGIYVRADIKGIDQMLAKLRDNEAFAAAWRGELTKLADTFLGRARANAPRRTGTLNSSFTQKMDSRPLPEWAFVGNDAKGRGGFPYPWALNVSAKFHRAGGKTPTKGWFTKPFQSMRKDVQASLESVARAWESIWRA